MQLVEQQNASGPVPKLALNRVEAAEAIGVSTATIDRLTLRGLLCPSRATRRPLYSVKELERFLKETTEADYVLPQVSLTSLPGQRANRQSSHRNSTTNFPDAPPSAPGKSTNPTENQNRK
jgi:hypothetical protein